MRKKYLWVVPIATMAAVLVSACGGDSTDKASPGSDTPSTAGTPTEAAAATDIVALKKTPASMAADDPAWKDARVTTVTTVQVKGSKSTTDKDVKMQALYSDTDVWFRFEWPDTTKTMRPEWIWDGTKWTLPTGQQDRLSLIWEITPITDFARKGCAAACHNPTADPMDKWYMVTPKTGEVADTWQWTAGITNGLNKANDQTLVAALTSPTSLGSSFVNDQGAGGDTNNRNTDGTAPTLMQDPNKKPSLGTDFLLVTEAVALDVSKLKPGDKIPGRTVAPIEGDRGDIDAKGTWANNTWTVTFHRKLDTGHATTDAKFAVGNKYPFGLAVFNALGYVDHTVTAAVYTLVLK